MKYKKYWIGIVLIFLLVTRLWQVWTYPAALTHDEIVYAVQAKSLAIQGKYLNQKDGWLSFQPAHPMYAELPAKFMAPFFLIFSNPLLATRALTILIGITFPFILAWLSFGIWKNKKLAVIVLSVAAINPLLWQMARLTYDAVFSTFFYLLGGAILLNVTERKKWLALLPLILGFFCYQGYKLLFVPWLIFLALTYLSSKGTALDKRSTIGVFVASLLIFIGYITVLLPSQNVQNRWQQTIFADTNYQAATTNDNRRLALDNPVSPIVSNKIMAISA